MQYAFTSVGILSESYTVATLGYSQEIEYKTIAFKTLDHFRCVIQHILNI